jgi:hypothetical protein
LLHLHISGALARKAGASKELSMARENQGLQIALIIFVMLTIVLGVTTFIFFRKYDEAVLKAKDSEAKADKADHDRSQTKSECDDLKRLIGMPNKSLEDVEKQFKSDMEAYAGNWPEESRFYSPILRRLTDTITSRDVTLAEAKANVSKLEHDLTTARTERDVQLKQFEEAVEKGGKDVVRAIDDATKAQKTKVEEETAQAKLTEEERIKARAAVQAAEADVKKVTSQWQQEASDSAAKSERIKGLIRTIPDVFNGQIDFVNQNDKTVWINLGRADGLERQITFSVYSGDSSEMGKASKKGIIEVTRITGDRMAEARIVEDKDSDPIMPGDKIFTPLWSAGEQRHFALAGFLDLSGEGKNDHAAVQHLITMNGGVIDCDGDKGNQTGKMTVNTNCLICGDPPGEKGSKEDMVVYSRMCGEAKRLNIPVISLDKLKEQMGFKNEAQVKHFGHVNPGGPGGNPAGTGSTPKPRTAPTP